MRYNKFKDIINFFRLEKETRAIKDRRILRDIKNLFENEEEENSYNVLRVSNSWSNNYIKCKSNHDRHKTLSAEEYLNKIRQYLKDKNNLKKADTCKTQLMLANKIISSIDNDEEHVMHSKFKR